MQEKLKYTYGFPVLCFFRASLLPAFPALFSIIQVTAIAVTHLQKVIQQRRSIYPKMYIPGKLLDRSLIEQLLEAARWAPTHRLTEPWRFHVFHTEEARRALGEYIVAHYEQHTSERDLSAEKRAKMLENPLRAGAVMAICMQRDPAEAVPEWEELAAVACAVQNMWLLCTEWNLGCYWSTPAAMIGRPDLLALAPGERCLGLFYLGWHNAPVTEGKRKPVQAVWR